MRLVMADKSFNIKVEDDFLSTANYAPNEKCVVKVKVEKETITEKERGNSITGYAPTKIKTEKTDDVPKDVTSPAESAPNCTSYQFAETRLLTKEEDLGIYMEQEEGEPIPVGLDFLASFEDKDDSRCHANRDFNRGDSQLCGLKNLREYGGSSFPNSGKINKTSQKPAVASIVKLTPSASKLQVNCRQPVPSVVNWQSSAVKFNKTSQKPAASSIVNVTPIAGKFNNSRQSAVVSTVNFQPSAGRFNATSQKPAASSFVNFTPSASKFNNPRQPVPSIVNFESSADKLTKTSQQPADSSIVEFTPNASTVDNSSIVDRQYSGGKCNSSPEPVFTIVDSTSTINSSGSSTIESRKRKNSDSKSIYPCTTCASKFRTKQQLRQHTTVHTSDRPFCCTHCSFKFKYKSSLNRHLATHVEDRPIPCPECLLRFENNRQLIEHHILTHMNEKESPPPVKVAEKAYQWPFRSTKPSPGARPYSCSQCSSRFKDKKTLSGHLIVHSDSKPFQCADCSSTFKTKNNLKMHSYIHSNYKPFPCDQCSAAFAQKANLQKHMLVHSNEKSFSCHVCHARFSQKSSMTRHLSVHSADRPYACHQCSFKFKRKSYLNRHLTIHSDQRTFYCTYCRSRFKYKKSLEIHLLLHAN